MSARYKKSFYYINRATGCMRKNLLFLKFGLGGLLSFMFNSYCLVEHEEHMRVLLSIVSVSRGSFFFQMTTWFNMRNQLKVLNKGCIQGLLYLNKKTLNKTWLKSLIWRELVILNWKWVKVHWKKIKKSTKQLNFFHHLSIGPLWQFAN